MKVKGSLLLTQYAAQQVMEKTFKAMLFIWLRPELCVIPGAIQVRYNEFL